MCAMHQGDIERIVAWLVESGLGGAEENELLHGSGGIIGEMDCVYSSSGSREPLGRRVVVGSHAASQTASVRCCGSRICMGTPASARGAQ